MNAHILKSTLALASVLALPCVLSAETATIYSNADSYIRSDTTTTNAGGDFRLLIGETASATANDLRIVLGFDLSSLPVNATINSVSLRLRIQENDTNVANSDTTLTLNLHALTESFTEGSVTWTNASTGTAWTTPGGTNSGTLLSSAAVPTKGTVPATYTWGTSTAFVNVVQAAYGSGSMVGFLLKDSDESGTLRELIRFISKDETGSSLQIYRPQLVVDYTLSTIPEPSTAAALIGAGGLLVAFGVRRRMR